MPSESAYFLVVVSGALDRANKFLRGDHRAVIAPNRDPLFAAAVLLGRYVHKASLRIQISSEKLNDQDAIFQEAVPREQPAPETADNQESVRRNHLRPTLVPVR
jgi:hypothetical protein